MDKLVPMKMYVEEMDKVDTKIWKSVKRSRKEYLRRLNSYDAPWIQK